jgi:hypothetical protein
LVSLNLPRVARESWAWVWPSDIVSVIWCDLQVECQVDFARCYRLYLVARFWRFHRVAPKTLDRHILQQHSDMK